MRHDTEILEPILLREYERQLPFNFGAKNVNSIGGLVGDSCFSYPYRLTDEAIYLLGHAIFGG